MNSKVGLLRTAWIHIANSPMESGFTFACLCLGIFFVTAPIGPNGESLPWPAFVVIALVGPSVNRLYELLTGESYASKRIKGALLLAKGYNPLHSENKVSWSRYGDEILGSSPCGRYVVQNRNGWDLTWQYGSSPVGCPSITYVEVGYCPTKELAMAYGEVHCREQLGEKVDNPTFFYEDNPNGTYRPNYR